MAELPEAIQWYEGMLLAPQHFQQLSLRQEELLYYHLSMIAPFQWGVRKLKIDNVLLIDGMLRVLELEAVMPDGLIVTHVPEKDKELEVDLTPYVEEMKQKPVTVHLVIPAKKVGASYVKGDLARFRSIEGKPVVDENTGESEVAIPRLVPRLKLLVTDMPPQKYTAFPLIKVGYRDETIAATDYIPPMLIAARSSEIGIICTSVAQRLREKAVFLSEKLSASSQLGGAGIIETRLLIQSIVAGLPYFEAILNTDTTHPYHLYLALCLQVGQLASLGSAQVPPVLSAYNHNDLRASFKEAVNYVFRMIDEGVIESHTSIIFDLKNTTFTLPLKEEWAARNLIIGVKGKTGVRESDLINWMSEALIGSESLIEAMKKNRILGAERTKIESDGELMPSKGLVLFSVKVEPEKGENRFIVPDQVLHVFNPSDPKDRPVPSALFLYVKNRP